MRARVFFGYFFMKVSEKLAYTFVFLNRKRYSIVVF